MEIKTNTQEVVKSAEKEVSVLEKNSRIVVNSQPTLTQAKNQLGVLKIKKNEYKDQKDGIIKPMNFALKNVRELFAPVEGRINVVEVYLKGQILTYDRKLEE